MTRNGKIARLPREVREELNRRLENGEQGTRLVEWLNGLPGAHEVLQERFGGRPITEQNLSEWKNGGYLEWEGQQVKRGLLRQVTAEARELNEITGGVEASRELVSVLATELALAVRDGLREMSDPKERREWLLQAMAALAPRSCWNGDKAEVKSFRETGNPAASGDTTESRSV